MRYPLIIATVSLLGLVSLPHGLLPAAETWAVPVIELPAVSQHPALACDAEELARLRAAYRGEGAEQRTVAALVAQADRALRSPLVFPPRGGQHNQWYQCEKCQTALKTIDPEHHQCPSCQHIYTGAPYDDVIFSRTHNGNLQNMVTAAWAYAITEQPTYAEFARRVLLGYAERYTTYPYHAADLSDDPQRSRSGGHLFEQTLNEAAAFANAVGPAYDLIHDWSGLSQADHQTVRTGLLVPMLENIARHAAGKSNWQTWHNAAFIWGGGLLRDEAWIRRAISDPENGFVFQLQTSVMEEGMWYENSWGYHFYTLSAMIEIAEAARRLNIELWSHPALKKMFTVALEYTMPDGRFPRFGDDTGTSIVGATWYLEHAYRAYRDPAMLPYLSQEPSRQSILFGRKPGPPPEPPQLSSRLFPGAGHAILRTQGEANLAAAITFGPYGGFHGHLDKLSFVLFGYGRELGYDPGRARSQAYRLPIHRDWYKATLSHNTVLVDGRSQQPAAGTLVSFAATEHFAAVVADCSEAYPGVRHRRLLCLTPDYLAVLDDLHSDAPHRYDWVYHNRADGVACDVASQPVAHLALEFPGQEYLQSLQQGQTEQAIRVRFTDEAGDTLLLVARNPNGASTETTVTVGDGVGASVAERIPLALVTRHGPAVQFAAVIAPSLAGAPVPVSAVDLQVVDGTRHLRVERGTVADLIVLDPQGNTQLNVGGRDISWPAR